MPIELIVGLLILGGFTLVPMLAVSKTFKKLAAINKERRQLTDWAKMLVRQVDRSAWVVYPGDLNRPPWLEGRVHNRLIRLRAHEGEKDWNVEVTINLDNPSQSELMLEPESTRQAISSYFRQEPRIGDEEFDGQFHIVTTANEDELRSLISEPIREGLLYVRQRRGGRVVLQLTRTELRFEERGATEELEGYGKLLLSLCALAAAAENEKLVTTEGSFLMELVAGNADSEATCPVCSTCLGETNTYCVACGTPHHADCWEYNGGCAIYACRCKDGRPAS